MEKLTRLLGGAGLGYASWKMLDSQFQVGNDVEMIQRLFNGLKWIELGPESLTVCELWSKTVETYGRKPCIVFTEDNRVLSFREVDQLANRLAYYCKQVLKFQPGDVVALFMENRPEFVWITLGLSKAGLVVALINSNNKQKPLLHSLKVAKCKAMIFGSELGPAVEQVLDELQDMTLLSIKDIGKPEIPLLDSVIHLDTQLEKESLKDSVPSAWISHCGKQTTFAYIYTSGTTGLPKASVIKNYKFLTMAMGGSIYMVTPDDRVASSLPMYHSSGLGLGLGNTLINGSTLILARKFSASNFMKDCTIHQATVVQYIGELCRYLLNSPETEWDTKHCIRIAIGNGLRKEIWVPFQKRFQIPEIGEFYGATEGNIAFGNHCRGVLDGDVTRVGSVGQAGSLLKSILGYKIVKHDVETESMVRDPKTGFCIECAPGEPGELLGKIDSSRASSEFVGYTDKKASEKKLAKDVFIKGDQYFRTGDLMRQEPNGLVYFVDRIGDTFRWKGENVSTGEVGEVVSTFGGILEANIYGVTIPHNEDGRACMAAIVLQNESEFDFDGLSKHIHKNLASYAIPMFIRILPQMEITGTFKHRKVDFVKDGIDPTKITDKVYYLDQMSKTYKLLDPESYQRITSPQSRL